MSTDMRGVGELASGLLHDLNQSLAIVVGFIELAERSVAECDSEEARSRLRLAGRAARDASAAIDRFFSLGRHDALAVRGPVDLGLMLHEVAQLTSPRWSSVAALEGRVIRVDVDAPSGLVVSGLDHRLRAALTNLVFNAIDAMPRGGRIRLCGRRSDHRIDVHVIDDGVGMPPDVVERCMEPFFTTKGEQGTGLGLAQVHAIVRQHGGSLRVTSTEGQGTDVLLRLPALDLDPYVATDETFNSGADEAHRLTRPARILVVEDSPGLRQLLAVLLERADHDVELVASAAEALARLRSGEYDVVVSDLSLSGRATGWDLAAVVRTRWPSIGFVLATGSAAGIDLGEAAHAGVDAVLQKPYRANALRQVVAELAARRRADPNWRNTSE